MKPCDDNRLRIGLYLDDELRDQDLRDFEAHLGACPGCREAVAGERRFLDAVRSAGPLYSAPAELRSRVKRSFEKRRCTIRRCSCGHACRR